jgi:hypothetical protein
MKLNQEKIILALCAVAALGLAYLGYAKTGSVEEEFVASTKGGGNNDAKVQGADILADTLAGADTPILLDPPTTPDGRVVDNFVGVPLYAKKPAAGESVAKPVDPVLDAEIHPGIPNRWWLENGISPEYANSPDRDEDKDGFSNREEFLAKTDPKDPKSFPALIDKLQYAKYESAGYFLWFSSSLGPQQYQFKIVPLPPAFEAAPAPQQETYLGQSGLKFNRTDEYIGDNTNIFSKGFGEGRFKLKKVYEKEVTNASTNLTTPQEFAVIEDLAPHKKEEFEIPKMPRTRERPATVRYDRSAVLVLNAAGEESKEFTVLENTTFSLPSSKGDKAYLLKSVTAEKIVVEYKDAEGQTKTIEINKN